MGLGKGRWLNVSSRAGAAIGLAVAAMLAADPVQAASQASVYTVANYPVQAQAQDAVTAKAQALAEGQQRALRSLLKRLVPVTAYSKLPKVQLARVQDMISGFSVRSETNSPTEYIAALDFQFQPRAVRDLLRSSGIAYVDEPAPPVLVVPVYRLPQSAAPAPAAKAGKAAGPAVAGLPAHLQTQRVAGLWSKAWSELDLDHALTPVKLSANGAAIAPETISGLLQGDAGLVRVLAGESPIERAVLAHAAPSADGRKLVVTLAGRDAVGWFIVERSYPIHDGDIAYTSELAAVVALGVLEGRWKSLKGRGQSEEWNTTTDRVDGLRISRPRAGDGAPETVNITVEFRGLGQWQQIRSRLTGMAGVEDLEVGQMTARAAAVSLRYPGGGERLAEDLAGQGMSLAPQAGQWLLQAR